MIDKGFHEIRETLSRGEPLKKFTIIDCHAHLGQWFNFHIPEFDEKSLIKSMDVLGIDKMCISALLSIGPDFLYGNEWVHKVVKQYPDRFFGYIGINPNYPELIESEIEKHWERGRMSAIKIHPETHDYPPDGMEYHRVYEILQERRGLLLSHVWGIDNVKVFGKLAKQYDSVTFILGHSGGVPKAIYEAIKVASECNNVYLDLTGSFHYEGIVELMVREVGADRVLFGTDAPFLDSRPAVGRVGYAEISEEDKAKILGLNMKKILDSLI
jgi:hypothetical protein